jgi:hypothetical protein
MMDWRAKKPDRSEGPWGRAAEAARGIIRSPLRAIALSDQSGSSRMAPSNLPTGSSFASESDFPLLVLATLGGIGIDELLHGKHLLGEKYLQSSSTN